MTAGSHEDFAAHGRKRLLPLFGADRVRDRRGTCARLANGENGKAIARNPGPIRLEMLIDHGGTPNDPSDDEFLAPTSEWRRAPLAEATISAKPRCPH